MDNVGSEKVNNTANRISTVKWDQWEWQTTTGDRVKVFLDEIRDTDYTAVIQTKASQKALEAMVFGRLPVGVVDSTDNSDQIKVFQLKSTDKSIKAYGYARYVYQSQRMEIDYSGNNQYYWDKTPISDTISRSCIDDDMSFRTRLLVDKDGEFVGVYFIEQ